MPASTLRPLSTRPRSSGCSPCIAATVFAGTSSARCEQTARPRRPTSPSQPRPARRSSARSARSRRGRPAGIASTIARTMKRMEISLAGTAILVLTHMPDRDVGRKRWPGRSSDPPRGLRQHRRTGGVTLSLARRNRNCARRFRLSIKTRAESLSRGRSRDPRRPSLSNFRKSLLSPLIDGLRSLSRLDCRAKPWRPDPVSGPGWAQSLAALACLVAASGPVPRARGQPKLLAPERAFALLRAGAGRQDGRGTVRHRRRLLPLSRQAASSRHAAGAVAGAAGVAAGQGQGRRVLRPGRDLPGRLAVRIAARQARPGPEGHGPGRVAGLCGRRASATRPSCRTSRWRCPRQGPGPGHRSRRAPARKTWFN